MEVADAFLCKVDYSATVYTLHGRSTRWNYNFFYYTRDHSISDYALLRNFINIFLGVSIPENISNWKIMCTKLRMHCRQWVPMTYVTGTGTHWRHRNPLAAMHSSHTEPTRSTGKFVTAQLSRWTHSATVKKNRCIPTTTPSIVYTNITRQRPARCAHV